MSYKTMWDLGAEILETSKRLKVPVKVLGADDSLQLLNELINAYCGTSYKYPLWEHIRESLSLHDPMGWQLPYDYLAGKGAYLFFEPEDTKRVVYFEDGGDIVKVLGESQGFVFYITNPEKDFLLSFNDHDYLIAAGMAMPWLSHMISHPDKGGLPLSR